MTGKKDKTLIFACNGVAPIGQMTNQVAFELEERGLGKVSCLSGIGAGIEAKKAIAGDADKRIAIDGCNLKCVQRILENAGLACDLDVVLLDAGMKPSGRKPTKQEIDGFAEYVIEKLGK